MNAGFERRQAEVVAKTIKQEVEERNNELATKVDIKRIEWMMGFLTIAGAGAFGYVISLLNTIIGVLPSIAN
jgi:hypothetical protein